MNNTIRLCGVFLLGAMITVTGCKKAGTTPAKVTGKVTYKGQTVGGGNLTFHAKEGIYPTIIRPDGTYSANQLPAGEMVVTVETESINPGKETPKYGGGKGGGMGGMSPIPEGKGGPKGTYVKIPAKYADKAKSDLKVTLTAGNQTKDIELKD